MTGEGAHGSEADGDLAGRIVMVVDLTLSTETQAACAELARALADRTGMPVTVTSVSTRAMGVLGQRLAQAEDTGTKEFAPTQRPPRAQPMSAAPFIWRADGRPDWGGMWSSFCELALFGGPPHRGPDAALRGPDDTAGSAETSEAMLSEMKRGIWEITGLYGEPAAHGWLAVTCESRVMAAWLCAAIILENVDARIDEDRLLVPAGPDYALTDQVKSIITVVAKTHHYWKAHIAGDGSFESLDGIA